MSDVSPDERPQPPRARRATRPKAKAYTARRAQKPATAPTNTENPAEPMSAASEAPATDQAIETSLAESTNIAAEPEAAGDKWTLKVRDMTVLSKEILLWAAIVALGSLVVSYGPVFLLGALNITQKDLQNNSGLVQGWGCLSILLIYGLPVVGGWRATMRQGDWRQGGFTGFWSVILLEILVLLISVIYGAVTGQLAQFTTADWGGFFVTLVIQLLVSFGLGAMGGYFSVWQRRRAEQSRELASSSS
jgi:hypothetical protein